MKKTNARVVLEHFSCSCRSGVCRPYGACFDDPLTTPTARAVGHSIAPLRGFLQMLYSNERNGLVIVLAMLSLLTVLHSLAIAATGKAPSEFRSVRWGSPPTRAMKRLSGPTGEDKLEVWTPVSKQSVPFLGVPVAEEAYLFTGGKLFSGQVFLDTEANLGKVKSELTRLYGKPDFANESLKIYRWQWPSEKIEVSISYQSRFQRTTVTFKNDTI